MAKGDNWLVATTRQEFDRLLNNIFARRPYTPKSVLRYLADHAIRNSAKSAKIFAEMQTNDPPLADRLPNITSPALIIWGDQDRVLHVSCADLFRKGIKSSGVMIIPELRTHAAGGECAERVPRRGWLLWRMRGNPTEPLPEQCGLNEVVKLSWRADLRV